MVANENRNHHERSHEQKPLNQPGQLTAQQESPDEKKQPGVTTSRQVALPTEAKRNVGNAGDLKTLPNQGAADCGTDNQHHQDENGKDPNKLLHAFLQ
jgi:hypothetical protein